MEENNWLKELTEKAKHDPYYQQCLAEARRLEPAFLSVRDTLPEAQRCALDAYISACEEMDHLLTLFARDITRERLQEEISILLQREACYAVLRQDVREHGPRSRSAGEWLDRAEREHTPEYLEMCRRFNEAARQIREEQGVEIPLIEL